MENKEHVVIINQGFTQSGFISVPVKALRMPVGYPYLGLLTYLISFTPEHIWIGQIKGMKWVDGSDEEAWEGHVRGMMQALELLFELGFITIRLREIGQTNPEQYEWIKRLDYDAIFAELKR